MAQLLCSRHQTSVEATCWDLKSRNLMRLTQKYPNSSRHTLKFLSLASSVYLRKWRKTWTRLRSLELKTIVNLLTQATSKIYKLSECAIKQAAKVLSWRKDQQFSTKKQVQHVRDFPRISLWNSYGKSCEGLLILLIYLFN